MTNKQTNTKALVHLHIINGRNINYPICLNTFKLINHNSYLDLFLYRYFLLQW